MSNRKLQTLVFVNLAVMILVAATGNIRWTQLRPGDIHGTGAKGQASDGTGASGNCAKYAADGSLTDSGNACTAGGTIGQISLMSDAKPQGAKGNNKIEYTTLTAGSTIDLLPTVSASGFIDHIWIANGSFDLEIKVYIDGEGTPSIDLTLPFFIGQPYGSLTGQVSFASKYLSSNSGAANQQGGYFRLPIPFSTSAHVTITNNNVSSSYTIFAEVDYETGVTVTNIPYTQKLFGVKAQTTGIAANAVTNLINVSTAKRGRLAGISWVEDSGFGSASPATAPLEGNFLIYIDGAGSPILQSSGSEDFFGMGGYFQGFTAPSIADDIGLFEKTATVFGAFRFFTYDPLLFTSGLKVTWQCGETAHVAFTGTCAVLSTVWYYTEK